MTSRLPSASSPNPQQRELEELWCEHDRLHEELVGRELVLNSLENSLGTFEQNFLLRCGARYIALDSLEAEIAKLLAQRHPDDENLNQTARTAREKASCSAEDYQAREREGPRRHVEHTAELKAVYRRAARRMHPDLGSSEEERRIRHD